MKYWLAALLLQPAAAPPADPPPGAAVEHWLITTDMWGNRLYEAMTLRRDGESLTGDVDGDPLAGTMRGDTLDFTVTGASGGTLHFTGTLAGDTLRGDVDRPANDTRARHDFTARRLPERPAGGPRTYDFAPTDFSNLFTADRAPVLTVWPGDTIRTQTIDSGGVDANGATRALYGNPQTGPFFIAGAAPGDTLVVRIDRLRPNRDWADSLDMIVNRLQSRAMILADRELGRPVRWTIDRAHSRARPADPPERLHDYSVPLRPMLGGIAVAPGFGFAPPSTGDSGRYGGNMDFNEVIEGNIVYLPVQQPGALLYVGDAHAAQGEGETSQFALETSMDVTITVDLIQGRSIVGPRVESPTHLMAIGQAGTMEEATRLASSNLTQWLIQDYGLTLSETAQLLGSGAQFSIVTLAGRDIGMVAKFPKELLAGLTPRTRPNQARE